MHLFIEISYLQSVKKRWLFIFLFLSTFVCFSQEQEPETPDLKVGLVLSGGGAKGLAHIGALKIIEQAGVKIDYIGGTSMGAIVGALYASGYSAKQIDSIFTETDFDRIIQDEIPRNAKTFYEKKNSERYAVTLPFENFKVSIPSALSKGQNVYNMLSRLLFHVSDVDDFDKLHIPFFCVATDIETGEAVILKSGNLVNAISASGAFPSLFNPIEINERLLIDGGVVNNYPVDELRELGANIIIGVDVQDALDDRETLKSATSILLQINNYRTVKDMKEKSKKTDIYIKPDITDYTVVSFKDADSIVNRGYEAALKKKGQLDSISVLQNGKTGKPEAVEPFTPNDSFSLNNLIINGNEKYSRAYIRGKLRYEMGENITLEKFAQGINNLAATNNFRRIDYYAYENEDEGYTVKMNLVESKIETFLRLGIHYDGLYKTAGLVNLTTKNILFNDDVLSFDFIVGDRLRYNFDYFLDKGFYWSFGIKSSYNSFQKGVRSDFLNYDFQELQDLSRISLEVEDLTNQIYLQTVYREEFTFGTGLEFKHLKIETETVMDEDDVELIFDNSNYLSLFGYLILDTYDNKYYPTNGIYFDGHFNFYFYSSDYTNQYNEFSIVKSKIGFSTPITKNLAFNVTTEGGFKIGVDDLSSLDFIFGGYGNDFINNYTPFYGYDFLSFGANSYVKATFKADWRFARKNHLLFAANYANTEDYMFKTTEWLDLPDYSGYAIGYGLETFIGPIEIFSTWSPENDESFWFVNVGFWF